MKTAIIVDSTATLPREIASLDNVFQIKLSVIFPDGEVREDSSDPRVISDYYNELDAMAVLPTTSQPTNGQIYEVYEEIIAAGYDEVYGIVIASKLSGTMSSLEAVSREFSAQVTTHIIDAKSTSSVSQHLVSECLRLLSAGHQADAIVPALKQVADESATYIIVGSLDNLVKGGRLSAAGAFFGNLLKITPLIQIDQSGALEVIDKIRTERKMKEKFKELYQTAYAKYGERLHVAIAHSNAQDRALSLVQHMSEELDLTKVSVSGLTPVVGTHVGNGSTGIFLLVDANL
ncbi:DegV family protein [Aerococcaceae bacterium 50-4]